VLVLAAALGLLAPAAPADQVLLVNGDRISGRLIGKLARRVRLQTPYGTLAIPRSRIERILYDDGTEELLNAPPAPPPPTPPPLAMLRIDVGGASFWRAWNPDVPPEDPSLRLELRLDERVIVTYTDDSLDPEDLPKAVVNSFVFSPERLAVRPAAGVTVAPPELAPGEIRLRLGLPASLAGPQHLRLAYQVNDGPSAEPVFWDVVGAETEVRLVPGSETRVRVVQDRGSMEYTRRRMRYVETFRVILEAATPAP
jgi:hypothetical protein